MTVSPFHAVAAVVALAALLGWVNHRFLRLPHTSALAFGGALASLLVVGIDYAIPGAGLAESFSVLLDKLNFSQTVMSGMLSFLLFAGALHVDLGQLRTCRWPVSVLASVGVLVSTLIVAAGFKGVALLAGFDLPFLWCVVFGAIISPTDPVAVLGILQVAKVPETVEATVAGEALFNDGAAVVIFSVVLAAAMAGAEITPWGAGGQFLIEAAGGAAVGLAIGWGAHRLMRAVDDYRIEVMLTLAVVMVGYAVCELLHLSGPIAMACAGLLMGNHVVHTAMSESVRDHVLKFWAVIDEILNSVLFLLIGLEAVALHLRWEWLLPAMLAVPLVLFARAVSVALPLPLWRRTLPFRLALPVLTWGGLRGGVSIALVLSLPATEHRELMLMATWLVVMFSVVVQAMTLKPLVDRLTPRPAPGAGEVSAAG